MKSLWVFSFLVSAMVAAVANAAPPVVIKAPGIGMIVVCCFMVAVGLLTHFVAKLAELEERGTPVSAKQYVVGHPYTAMSVVLSSYGLLLLAYCTGELGPVGAFCMGVAAQSAGDKMRAKAGARVDAMGQGP